MEEIPDRSLLMFIKSSLNAINGRNEPDQSK